MGQGFLRSGFYYIAGVVGPKKISCNPVLYARSVILLPERCGVRPRSTGIAAILDSQRTHRQAPNSKGRLAMGWWANTRISCPLDPVHPGNEKKAAPVGAAFQRLLRCAGRRASDTA